MHVATQRGGNERRVAVCVMQINVHQRVFAQQLHHAVIPQASGHMQGGGRLINWRGLHVQIGGIFADGFESEDGVLLCGKTIRSLLFCLLFCLKSSQYALANLT